MSQRAESKAVIRNRLGLHARPAMSLVDTASIYSATVTLKRADDPKGEAVDGKSIMQVMLLAATQGTELVIVCEGDDASDACDALIRLIEDGFDEE